MQQENKPILGGENDKNCHKGHMGKCEKEQCVDASCKSQNCHDKKCIGEKCHETSHTVNQGQGLNQCHYNETHKGKCDKEGCVDQKCKNQNCHDKKCIGSKCHDSKGHKVGEQQNKAQQVK